MTGGYRGVFFDMDGVVLDSSCLWEHIITAIKAEYSLDLSVLEASGGFELSTREAIRAVLEDMGIFSPDLYAAILSETDILYSRLFGRFACLREGMRSLLSSLAGKGVKTALVSNSSGGQMRLAAGHFALEGLFCAIVSSDDVVHGKPSPEPYLKALSMTGLNAREVVAVEDSVTGARAAAAAGMDYIMIVPDACHDCDAVLPVKDESCDAVLPAQGESCDVHPALMKVPCGMLAECLQRLL